ncbi:hypothetical protein Q9L58_005696 [Maublancomyces gigas]|uniref:Uncharacterized protein n=1 Tax=Discina gigas TaxID=1032678 RepID=A0ABR3GHR4_9PEZI
MTSAIPISDFDRDQPITDVHIASFINFLFRSSVKRRHPLQLPRRGIQDDEPDFDANISHAPVPGVTGFRRYRTVLDALVGVCVSNAHQCLALSVTFGETSILATFAENQTKPPASIEQHLLSVWKQLGALSRLQQSVRKANDLIDIPGDSGISPKAADISKTAGLRPVLQKHSGERGALDLPGGIVPSCCRVSQRLAPGRQAQSRPPTGRPQGVAWAEGWHRALSGLRLGMKKYSTLGREPR